MPGWDKIMEFFANQPIAVALLIVIWWLFKRLREVDKQKDAYTDSFSRVTNFLNGMALALQELTTTINICCKGNGRGKNDR